jgi:hypothetical protein
MEPTSTAKIEGVHVDIDAIKAGPKTKEDLQASGYFDHLPAAKQDAAYTALHKLVHDNDVPEKVSDVVDVQATEPPKTGGLKKATSAAKE